MYPKQKISPAYLVFPILLFPIWYIPYRWLNEYFIVNWLGHPKDVAPTAFNCNDLTTLFWYAIAILATILAVVFSKKLLQGGLRVLYIIGVFVVSVGLAYWFDQMMQM